MTRRLRRPGSPWRILVHEWLGRAAGQPLYGRAHHVSSDRRFGGGQGLDTEWSRHIELPNTEFDELVIARWLHLECMDSGVWWMDIGGVTVLVTADRDGRPKRVSVFGPGDYADPVPGCEYALTWSREASC